MGASCVSQMQKKTCLCWPWKRRSWPSLGFRRGARPAREACLVHFNTNASPWQEHRLPCGLLPSQVSELLDRDITPDDYEMLLQLDEALARPTADKHSLDKSLTPVAKEVLGETCSVCLHAFERSDSVSALRCSHMFHEDCISKWLLERCAACPLCNDGIRMS
ncbi:unnamed protein product [Effrenium voratum]|nr:unnamed protein product [Effrenium voratum]CAJ1415344.1 unnamed protein product [Effrenium voratum]|mmetsp:Transcript_49939/g.119132  ORF Transcript_49939/g.119132 Transcript_49939/m.119132 type:complete len:163 (+) Transcript_49939:99-587(+)|eukprot:CAMPEP_0181439608 /NCGR_PEP_ID=MMETSP1110-20121109/22519_1 /TAXON_ID=174948 /ORGANISM="Symbiodinium sp., Strain CCMP421" /LENGTH=162 /DNA_ID=CAMNT_0023563345 /DNA_START=85 /DNA_END=573 /DNA_ORIENTATION=+